MRRWNKRYSNYDFSYDLERYYYGRGWDSGLRALFAHDCSYAKGHLSVTVDLSCKVETMIYRLVREVEGEFLAYSLGTKSDDGYRYTIEGLYVPEQEAGFDRVEITESHLPEDRPIIGTIHSHGPLQAFLSSWDEDFVGSNHDLSLIVGRRGQEWLAVARMKLPCGMLHLAKAEINFERPQMDLGKELERIKQRKISYLKTSELEERYRSGYRPHMEIGGDQGADQGKEWPC